MRQYPHIQSPTLLKDLAKNMLAVGNYSFFSAGGAAGNMTVHGAGKVAGDTAVHVAGTWQGMRLGAKAAVGNVAARNNRRRRRH